MCHSAWFSGVLPCMMRPIVSIRLQVFAGNPVSVVGCWSSGFIKPRSFKPLVIPRAFVVVDDEGGADTVETGDLNGVEPKASEATTTTQTDNPDLETASQCTPFLHRCAPQCLVPLPVMNVPNLISFLHTGSCHTCTTTEWRLSQVAAFPSYILSSALSRMTQDTSASTHAFLCTCIGVALFDN